MMARGGGGDGTGIFIVTIFLALGGERRSYTTSLSFGQVWNDRFHTWQTDAKWGKSRSSASDLIPGDSGLTIYPVEYPGTGNVALLPTT